jgi:DNA-directed RNA polymerase subunit RPC12/RpoP
MRKYECFWCGARWAGDDAPYDGAECDSCGSDEFVPAETD